MISDYLPRTPLEPPYCVIRARNLSPPGELGRQLFYGLLLKIGYGGALRATSKGLDSRLRGRRKPAETPIPPGVLRERLLESLRIEIRP